MLDINAWRDWVISAPASDFWLWSLAALVIAGVAFFGIFYFVRRARLIEDTPTSKVRSATQGYVELIGTGHNLKGQSLMAPLTATPCTWYRYKIQRRVQSGKSTRWQTVKSETSSLPLLLKDSTGRCVINPTGAEVIPAVNQVWYGHASWPSVKAIPRSAGMLGSLVGRGRYRYTEQRMHPGETLYALGEFVTLSGNASQQGIDRQVSATLRSWKQKPEQLLQLFDTDQDGNLDLEEWEQVRTAARKIVLKDRLAKSTRIPVHTLGRSRNGQPFILSTESQRSMSRKFRLKAAACLAVFILCGPASVWMMLTRVAS
jgi:hypothetical protein